MTAPRFADCRCSHAKAEHEREGFAPQCTAIACTCLAYRPGTGPTRPVPVPPRLEAVRPEPQPAVQGERVRTIEQVLREGKASEFQRTVKLTEKIALMVHDLSGRLADEREASEEKRRKDAVAEVARQQIVELETKLAEAKALLRGTPTARTSTPRAAGNAECPDCWRPSVEEARLAQGDRIMNSVPLFVYPLAVAVGASLLVGLAYLWFERPRNPIDMSGLTDDHDPSTVTVDELLDRVEPYRVAADEAIALTQSPRFGPFGGER